MKSIIIILSLIVGLNSFASSVQLLPKDIKLVEKIIEVLQKLDQNNNQVWNSYLASDYFIQLNRKGRYDCLIGAKKPTKDHNVEITIKNKKTFCRLGGSPIESSFRFLEITGTPTLFFQFSNLDDQLKKYKMYTDSGLEAQDPYLNTILFLFHELFHIHQNSMIQYEWQNLNFHEYLELENISLAILEYLILSEYINGNTSSELTKKQFLSIRELRREKYPTSTDRDQFYESSEGTPKYVEYRLLEILNVEPKEKGLFLKSELRNLEEFSFQQIQRNKAYTVGMVLIDLLISDTDNISNQIYTSSPSSLLFDESLLSGEELKNTAQELLKSDLYKSASGVASQIIDKYNASLKSLEALYSPDELRILLPGFRSFSAYGSFTLPSEFWAAMFGFYNQSQDGLTSIKLSNRSYLGTRTDDVGFVQSLTPDMEILIDGIEQGLVGAAKTRLYSKSLVLTAENFSLEINGSGELRRLTDGTFILLPNDDTFSNEMEKVFDFVLDDPIEKIRSSIVTW